MNRISQYLYNFYPLLSLPESFDHLNLAPRPQNSGELWRFSRVAPLEKPLEDEGAGGICFQPRQLPMGFRRAEYRCGCVQVCGFFSDQTGKQLKLWTRKLRTRQGIPEACRQFSVRWRMLLDPWRLEVAMHESRGWCFSFLVSWAVFKMAVLGLNIWYALWGWKEWIQHVQFKVIL